jgi:hypothetical protein
MEMFERAQKLGGVVPAAILIEFAFPLKVVEQLSTVNCIHISVQ